MSSVSSSSSSSSLTTVTICPCKDFAYKPDISGIFNYMNQIFSTEGYYLKFNTLNHITLACVSHLSNEYSPLSKNRNYSLKNPNTGTGSGSDREAPGCIYGVNMNLSTERATVNEGEGYAMGTCYFESSMLSRVQNVLATRGFTLPVLTAVFLETMPTPMLAIIDGYLGTADAVDYMLTCE